MLDRLSEFIGLTCKVLLIGTAILVSCTVIFLFVFDVIVGLGL